MVLQLGGDPGWSKMRVYGRSLARTAGLNSEWMSVSYEFLCYQVKVSATGRSLVQRSPTDCSPRWAVARQENTIQILKLCRTAMYVCRVDVNTASKQKSHSLVLVLERLSITNTTTLDVSEMFPSPVTPGCPSNKKVK